MSAPAILQEIFKSYRTAWGQEDDGYVFDNGPDPLERIDVLVYRPTATLHMTTLATIGMAAAEMPPGGRAELRFARAGRLSPDDESAIAIQLANLAISPWTAQTSIGWGRIIGLDREFPTFPGCQAVFLSGPFTAEGRDYIDTAEGKVRVINIVPITEAERAQAKTMPPIDFLQALMAQVNIFTARPAN
ncbi:MAG TPA: suppressor of fused domain protein [Candidatus Limnocylindrales bacterium]|nr:suppressor of fused domain protein [Candidatus Limnocylindrales bacterium]